jgi:2-succinyl-6-hydroxy-2,4-cyclohexadiene-1-carboxylate synthase
MKIPPATIKAVLRTGRFEIPYRVYENDGPHLICLNGIQQSMAMWQGFVTRFARDYRIILFNFPGQGKGRSLSGPVRPSLAEEVDILSQVMKATYVNHDVSLCTASWGGIVALAYAVKHPQAVKRLLLGSIGTRPNQKMIETIQRGRALDLKDRAQIADLIIDSFGQKLPEPVKQRIAVQFRSISKENLQSFCDHGLNVISVQKFSDHIDLKKVSVETVLIRGEEDTIVDLEDVMFLSSQIPNSQLRIIKNVGHFLHMESEAVFDVYRELLSNTVGTINDYVACEG